MAKYLLHVTSTCDKIQNAKFITWCLLHFDYLKSEEPIKGLQPSKSRQNKNKMGHALIKSIGPTFTENLDPQFPPLLLKKGGAVQK